MKPDIGSLQDIERMVTLFYDKAKADKVIGHFFTGLVPMNWDRHLSLMCSFWENVLLSTGDYEGNPMETHRRIHAMHPTTAAHFDRWLELFTETVDELFSGEKAAFAKQRAAGIAQIMLSKIAG